MLNRKERDHVFKASETVNQYCIALFGEILDFESDVVRSYRIWESTVMAHDLKHNE